MTKDKNTYKHIPEDKNDPPGNLNSLKGKNPFKTPEGYFDNLPARIEDKIKSSESDKRVTLKLFQSKQMRYAAAVLIFLLIGAGIAGIWINEIQLKQNNLSEINVESTLDYTGISEMDLLYFMTYEEQFDSTELLSDEVRERIIDQILAENRIETLYLEQE